MTSRPTSENASNGNNAAEARLAAALTQSQASGQEEEKPKPAKASSGYYMLVFHAFFVFFMAGMKGFVGISMQTIKPLTELDAPITRDVNAFLQGVAKEAAAFPWLMALAFAAMVPVAMIRRSARAQGTWFRLVLFLVGGLYVTRAALAGMQSGAFF